MSIVQKVKSGLTFKDSFEGGLLNPLWNISPNDPSRYSVTEVAGSLRLRPTDSIPTYAFLDPLTSNKDFVLDVRNSYFPVSDGDEAGIVVYTNEEDMLPLEQYYGVDVSQYQYLRLVRKENLYEGYASTDGSQWRLIGSEYYWNDAPKIGLFIKSAVASTPATPVDTMSFDVMDVRVFNGTEIVVGNLIEGMVVELVNTMGERMAWGVCHTGNNFAVIEVSHLPIPFHAGINIYSKNGDKMTSNLDNPIEFWGGDEYKFSISPDVFYFDDEIITSTPVPPNTSGNMQKIEEETETYLGYINGGNSGYAYRRIMLKNNEVGRFTNLIVGLHEYNNTNDYLTMADIALDVNGSPDVFGKTISLPKLDSGEGVIIWMKIQRDSSGIPKDNAYFRVQVESIYSY